MIITHSYIGPLGKCLGVLVPGDLNAYWIATHFIKVRIPGRSAVKELPPKKLSVQRQWGICTLYLLVQISQLVVEETGTQTPEPQIRRESCLTGQQRLGRHFRSSERSHPRLSLQMSFKSSQSFCFSSNPHGRF